MRVVTFKISEELLRELDVQASKLGIPRSELIRTAVRDYLWRLKKSRSYRIRVRRVIIV